MSDQPQPIYEPVLETDSTTGSGAIDLQTDLQTDPTPQYTDNNAAPAQQIVDQQIDGANPFTVNMGTDVKPVSRQSQSGTADGALMRESQPVSGVVAAVAGRVSEVPQDTPRPVSVPATQVTPTRLNTSDVPTELPTTPRQIPQTSTLSSILTAVPAEAGTQTRQSGMPDLTRSGPALTLVPDGGVRVPVDKPVTVGGSQIAPEMSGAKPSLVGLTGVTTVGGMTNPAERVPQNLSSRMDTAQVMRAANERILAEDSGGKVTASPEMRAALTASADSMARRYQGADVPEDLVRTFTTPKFSESSVKSALETGRLLTDANRVTAVVPDSTRFVSEGTKVVADSTRFVSDTTRLVTDSARSAFDGTSRFVADSARLAMDATRLVTDAKGQVLLFMSPCTVPESKTQEVLAATEMRSGSKEPNILPSNPYRLLETQSANETRVRTAASLQLHTESGRASILPTLFATEGGRVMPIRPVERADMVARTLTQQTAGEFEPLSVRARRVVALEMAGTRSSATTGAAERFPALKIDSRDMLDQSIRRQLTLTGTAKLDSSMPAAGPTQFVATVRRAGDPSPASTTGSGTIGNVHVGNVHVGNVHVGNGTIVASAGTRTTDATTTRDPVTKDTTVIPGLVSGDLCTCRNGQKCALCLEASRNRLEHLIIDTSPENPTLNMLALELALIALVTVAAVAKENDRDPQEAQRSQNDDRDEQAVPVHGARPTHMVKKGDTLDSIAEQHFGDRAVAFLIADMNKGRTRQTYADGKLIVEIYENTSIELPVWNELRKAYREGALNLAPKVLTIVLGNPLTSALNRQSLSQLAIVLGGGSTY